MELEATITITPRKTVLHPESQTISEIVKKESDGHLEKLIIGRFISIQYNRQDKEEVQQSVKKLMEMYLYSTYSPLLYDFDIKIEEKSKD
ncbi:phosphoribosylformylglycinamidine synthase subunit PurS [Candidatus Woesearchaeota archaeon]|nr:phosphoribosylformylglycinamidine synthase subunit PurS [Candidatus Woesearchaeota archaeon]